MPAEVWPSRDVDLVRPYCEATPQTIYRYELAPDATREELQEQQLQLLDRADFTVHHAALNETGLLRIYTDHTEKHTFDALIDLIYGFRPNAAYLSSRTVSSTEFQESLEEGASRLEATANLSSYFAPGLKPTSSGRRLALRSGMSLNVPLDVSGDVRGVLIHLTAMFGNDYEREVIDSLAAHGWVVIEISTESSIDPPIRPEHANRLAELNPLISGLIDELVRLEAPGEREVDPAEAARNENRLAEIQRELSEASHERAALARGSFQVCDESDVEPVAHVIATAVDDLIAEHAYAAEAALEFMHNEYPGLRAKPVAIIGFSAGALVAPAVAARLIEEVDAVVLVGGGADLFRIARRGAFSDGGVRIQCGDEPTSRPLMDRLEQAYLAHCKLDPFAVAPCLRLTPVLQVGATLDLWVPASAGRLLAERLGHPSRLTHFGGHRSLFYFLPSQADRIARWLDDACEVEE